MKKIAFIGTGNMGSAIVRAVVKTVQPDTVCISNRTRNKSEALASECGCEVAADNLACAKDADYIFLGVKPYAIRDVLREIAPILTKGQAIVSMAAGVESSAMRDIVPKNPIVRILPNTPCAIGKGLVLIVPCGDAAKDTVDTLAKLLAPCGRVDFTDEAHADAGMVIGGCTPAFTYQFIEALADGGVLSGLPRAQAISWAAQAVAGGAEMVLHSGKHPGQLKDEVCSPGGSTIEGVKALESHAFRGAVMEAVEAAFEKNKKLGK